MNVYLVEKDNGESYEDFYKWVDGAYTTFRKATESLLADGYTPYYEILCGKGNLHFQLYEEGEFFDVYSYAQIIEMEVDARD